jgi:PAS domain S-box-containing protein
MVLPSWLNLDSLSLIRMSSLIVSLSIAAYLFRLKGRSPPTLFLAWTFLGASLFNLSALMEFACPTYWQPANLKNLLIPFPQNLGPSIAALALLLFAYSFPHFQKPDHRERRRVLSVAVAANICTLILAGLNFLVLQRRRSSFTLEMPYYILFYSVLAGQFALVVIILLRKTVRFSTGRSRPWWRRLLRPQGRDALAARSLALAILLLPLILAGYSLMTVGVFAPSAASYLVWLLFLFFYFTIVITYFNHTAERTTLQLKLVGVALLFVLGVMSLVGLVVGRSAARDYRNDALVPSGRTIGFTPNLSGGYDIAETGHRFETELGPPLHIGYGDVEPVALPFPFTFFGETYDTIRVLHGPMIYLGAEILEDGWGGYHPQPAIAPLVTNLEASPGGGIYCRRGPESLVLTWYKLSEFGRSNSNTIQLILSAGGTFTFTCEELQIESGYSSIRMYVYTTANVTGLHPGAGSDPVPYGPRLIGIHPGRLEAPLEPVRFAGGLPYGSSGPAVLYQDYESAFFRYLHRRMAPLMLIQIAAGICILFLLPLLLKTSLIFPLADLYRGMERADRGDLDVSLASRFNDEIGALSRYFTKMLRSVKKAEANFRALAENALDSILIVDAQDRPVFTNRRACDLIGRSAAELGDLRLNDLLAGGPAPGGRDADPAAAQIETLIATRRGGRVPVEVTRSPTTWHGASAEVVILRDISERRRRESEARLRRQRLRQTDKLTTLGVLAARMAHQINVPNQSILANAGLLKRAGPQLRLLLEKDEEQGLIAGLERGEFSHALAGMLADIEACSRRIDGIVAGLKNYSRSPPDEQMSLVDINTVIRAAVELVSGQIRDASDRFTLSLAAGLPPVRGNSLWLEQVIVNLVMNACQALPRRDRGISLESRQVRETKSVQIVVRDQGAGIPAADLARITELFFTTRYEAGGTGLGLYVSEQIIREHRGRLSFRSRPDEGTEAVITLPAEEI